MISLPDPTPLAGRGNAARGILREELTRQPFKLRPNLVDTFRLLRREACHNWTPMGNDLIRPSDLAAAGLHGSESGSPR